MKTETKPNDLPRDLLMAKATEALKSMPGSKVYFKFTCENCGERVSFSEPNKLYATGECCKCGHVTPIRAGGFVLDVLGSL